MYKRQLFALIGFGLVGVRLLYMQVFNHDFYVQQATALQTRDTFITPNRGKIYDANMQVLAESAAVERITVDPKAVVDESKVKTVSYTHLDVYKRQCRGSAEKERLPQV